MVFKFISNLKEPEKGITLVEVVVVVIIIALFSLIVIGDFPSMQAQFALSTATHTLAQDLRRAEDLGLSGVKITDIDGNPINVKGYGVYASYTTSVPYNTQYIIYADLDNDHRYDGTFSTTLCGEQANPNTDCPVQIIDISQFNPSLYISSITDSYDNVILGTGISVNFVPPDPTVDILDNYSPTLSYSYDGVKIILSNGIGNRTIFVNNYGLIDAQ